MTDPVAMNTVFTSASLIVAFFGGMIMLFAPCCITLMLPAYIGSVFKARSKVILMTLVFAAGVASIMLPLVLGARFLASFFSSYHFYVFAAGSLLMIAIGFLSLFNKTIEMPFVKKLRSPRLTNAGSAFLLGVFSGISSSCCAPVLIGALSLAAISPTMLQAAAVGLAYTFGIVFPLFILALFFEKGYHLWGMKLRQINLSFGAFKVSLANFISFLIFTVTGTVFLILAMTDRTQMGEGAVQFGITIRNWVDGITKPIRALPYSEYLFGALLIGIILYFVYTGLRKKKEPDENP